MGEDTELVCRMQLGDLEAFEALYHKYKTRLYQTALAITGDRGAAEEMLQDCFVRAYRARERLNPAGPLSPWLHRIIVNCSYNWINRHRQPTLTLDTRLEQVDGAAVSPEAVAEVSERSQIVREAVAELDFRQRAVVILFYFQGFTLQEIAYILDCPVGTVKSRLHRACGALREKLLHDGRLVIEMAYATP